MSSWITYEFLVICILDSVYKNTALSVLQPQNLFICLRSCLLCFFSFTSSGADGLSAINQGPKKLVQSRWSARNGAWDTRRRQDQIVRKEEIQGEDKDKKINSYVIGYIRGEVLREVFLPASRDTRNKRRACWAPALWLWAGWRPSGV